MHMMCTRVLDLNCRVGEVMSAIAMVTLMGRWGGVRWSKEKWRESEQNYSNCDRNDRIKRVNRWSGAGTEGSHSHTIDFSYGFERTGARCWARWMEPPLCCTLLACSDNKDSTKLFAFFFFFFFNLWAFVNSTLTHQLGKKKLQGDYVFKQYVTLMEKTKQNSFSW